MISRSDLSRQKNAPSSFLFAADSSGEGVFDIVSRVQRTVDDLSFLDAEVVMQSPETPDIEDSGYAEVDLAETRLASVKEVARVEGYEEARRQFGEELALELNQERQRIERVRGEFARDRQKFFAAAESQVVQLALAVARKILARDAAVEGLPLRSTVKAALERVQDESSTVLRVPLEEQDAWRAIFPQGARGSIHSGSVTVIEDGALSPGECVLETSVGRVELGVDLQMAEVERGFRELMQNREEE